MEGLAAAVLLIAIMLGVLLAIAGLVYLLAHGLPKRPWKPMDRRIRIGGIILILLVAGLWVGIKSASNGQPPAGPPQNCPTGGVWTSLQTLCNE